MGAIKTTRNKLRYYELKKKEPAGGRFEDKDRTLAAPLQGAKIFKKILSQPCGLG
ncbi:MAG: hypothetical protein NT118_02760 [Lentisphaerae bacterium]|nr:hypothetical protein [Lentisphaerota bacterium]